MTDVITIYKNDDDDVLKVELNGVEINKDNIGIIEPSFLTKTKSHILMLYIEPENVKVVNTDDDGAPPCQSCFKAPYTMQNDDGDYLCDSCYSASIEE